MRPTVLAIGALVLASGLLGACSSIEANTGPVVGSPPLCAPGVALGDVVVAPLTRWRADQKEKEDRAAIAQRAIESAFGHAPCASSVKVLAASPDGEVAPTLAQAKAGGAETAVLVRIDELGPILILSFPALWSTWSDVKFSLDAVDLESGQPRLRLDHHRKVGGAFQLRGVAPLQAEMETALAEVITGKK